MVDTGGRKYYENGGKISNITLYTSSSPRISFQTFHRRFSDRAATLYAPAVKRANARR